MESCSPGGFDVERDVTVVVPSFRRVQDLSRCLEALGQQMRRPAEVIVVCRESDLETRSYLSGRLPVPVRMVPVELPGQAAALAAGLNRAETPLVALTDDDAVAAPDWLCRLVAPFDDPKVGGVGGRDLVHGREAAGAGSSSAVGIITSWGRLIGNHHVGAGGLREVAVLKGVNCMYRTDLIAIPSNLRGSGAQVYNEIAIANHVRMLGGHLLYDSSIQVEHFPGRRHDRDARVRPALRASFDAAYNLTLSVGSVSRGRAVRRVVYALAIGDRSLPGLGRVLVALAQRDSAVELVRKLGPTIGGNTYAGYMLLRRRVVEYFPRTF